MTALFVAIVLAVFVGGVCLWLSGMLLGRRERPGAARAAEANAAELKAVAARLEEAESRARAAEEIKARAEQELGRAATELGSVAGEMARAEDEIERLKNEAAELKKEVEGLQQASKHRLKPPPLPTRSEGGDKREEAPRSEDLDFALAQLDIERVAHNKTRDELDQLKKSGAPVQVSDGRPSVPPAVPGLGVPGRRGAGFQTVSIAARSQPVTGSDHDRLRQSHDQLQREKERIEAELTRAQQELQLIKMRRD